MLITRYMLFVVCHLCIASICLAQTVTLVSIRADDGKRIESLEKSGSRIEGTHVILWFPPSLTRVDAEALLKRLDPAVDALWRRVGAHDWQVAPKQKITYYLHDDAFIAHASVGSGRVFTMAVVKDGRAPFLHKGGA